VDVLGVV